LDSIKIISGEKMSDQHTVNKVSQDVDKVKKDINTLVKDGVFQVSKFGENVSQATDKAKDDVTTWVEVSASQLNKGYKKIKGDVKVKVVDVATTVKKEVGNGLSSYNAKAQEIADKVPGGLGKKAVTYPWVAISTALVVGFVLGGFLKSTRKVHQ
jgi:ElaB/YqjD/DUF883 family membrane-anchored ribosome-binding protein